MAQTSGVPIQVELRWHSSSSQLRAVHSRASATCTSQPTQLDHLTCMSDRRPAYLHTCPPTCTPPPFNPPRVPPASSLTTARVGARAAAAAAAGCAHARGQAGGLRAPAPVRPSARLIVAPASSPASCLSARQGLNYSKISYRVL